MNPIPALPLARDDGLVIERVGAEIVVYDNSNKEAHCLAPLAAAVFAHCDGRRPAPELAKLVSAELDDDVSVEDIDEAIVQLDERALLIGPRPGISRREVVRKTAAYTAAAAATGTLVKTIIAPTPAAAASCAGGCQTSPECHARAGGNVLCNCNNRFCSITA